MSQFKSFVSESELDERRQKRQQQWEKVRKPDDPVEAPEEEYDPKSLFERLQEQKDRKQAEYEEAHKLKNMIRGLDDDEVEFLDLVDRTKEEIEVQRWKEEVKEIQEFRKAVATLAEKSADQRLQELKKEANLQLISSAGAKKSQTSLLAGVVKRKSCDQKEGPEKRSKIEHSESGAKVDEESNLGEKTNESVNNRTTLTKFSQGNEETIKNSAATEANDSRGESSSEPSSSPVACVGVLPGLGVYSDSSDSEDSSCSDEEHQVQFDLLGRPRLHNVDE